MPELEKISLTFSSFNPFRPTLSLTRGNYFLVSVVRQTFLGFQMTSDSPDTSLVRDFSFCGRLQQ